MSKKFGKLAQAVAIACCAAVTLPALAATEADKLAAINSGLSYLAGSQASDGSWVGYASSYQAAGTGSAVLAMLEQGQTESTGIYKTNVASGLSYLFNSATIDGSGRIYWGGEDTYQTGLALAAIATTKTPTAIIAGSGPLAGMTYKQVVEGVVKYFADGQNTAANQYKGSWGYSANYGNGDNSTTQWPIVGLMFAQSKMGVAIPASVLTNLTAWTGYIQDLSGTPGTGTYGASGYSDPTSYPDVSKTGGLLLELFAEGKGLSDPQVQAALGFINRNWVSGGGFAGAPWDGNFGQPYAMWSVYKGLQTMIGLGNTSQITNLNAQGAALLDAGDTWNWYEDYTNWLVANQKPGGYWDGYSPYWTGPMATAWDINILLATEVAPPSTNVPEPGSLALVGLALAALTRAKRRKAL